MIKKISIIGLFVIIVLTLMKESNNSLVYAATPTESLFLAMNWNVGTEKESNFIAPTKEQILDLFNELLPNGYSEFMSKEILDYELKDLNKDGIYEIIVPVRFAVTVDFVSVVCRVGDTIRIKHFSNGYEFKDLNNDGKTELLIITRLVVVHADTVEGGTTLWYDVYQWDGSNFELANNKYPEFYKDLLAKYNYRIQKLQDFDPYKKASETGESVEFWQDMKQQDLAGCREGAINAKLIVDIPVKIEFDPKVITLKKKVKWINCHIRLPREYNVRNVDVSSVLLNGSIHCDDSRIERSEHKKDNSDILNVKFDLDKLSPPLVVGKIELIVTGKFFDGKEFAGKGSLGVLPDELPKNKKGNKNK